MSEIITWFCINYPEIRKELLDCSHSGGDGEVNPYHIEGDCWSHTMMVCKMMEINSSDKALLVSALLHDIGKPAKRRVSLKNGHIQFFGHEEESALLAKPILAKMVNDGIVDDAQAKEALELISKHGYFYKAKDIDEVYQEFVDRREFFLKLTLLVECDHLGRFGSSQVEHSFEKIKDMIEKTRYLLEQK